MANKKQPLTIADLLENAARGVEGVAYGGAAERLIWEILSPGCDGDQRNADALIKLIVVLEEAAKIGDEDEIADLRERLTAYAYVWGKDDAACNNPHVDKLMAQVRGGDA